VTVHRRASNSGPPIDFRCDSIDLLLEGLLVLLCSPGSGPVMGVLRINPDRVDRTINANLSCEGQGWS
jgi:hypothetical protein